MSKTIHSHRVAGSYRPDRHAGPEPESGIPAPMRNDLSPLDMQYRDKYGKLLLEAGTLSMVDGMCLDLMATLSTDIENLTRIVREAGYMSPTGKTKHPALSALNAAQAHLIKILCQFGLTAKSRTGLGTGANERDELMEFLRE